MATTTKASPLWETAEVEEECVKREEEEEDYRWKPTWTLYLLIFRKAEGDTIQASLGKFAYQY